MSQENVEIVRRGWDAWERGDLSAVLQMMSDDLVTHRAPPFGDARHGPKGFLEVNRDWMEGFAEWSVTPTDYLDAGDRVVVRTAQKARGKESGVPVAAVFWFVFALRDGKVVRIDIHAEEAAALEAAGLRE